MSEAVGEMELDRRVLGFHAGFCPAERTIAGCVRISISTEGVG